MARRVIIPVLCAALVGCQSDKPDFTEHGSDRTVRASVSFRTLYATLPAHARVNAVMIAAERSFRERGYGVQRAVSTSDGGTIIAEPPDPSAVSKIKFKSYVYGSGTRVEITVEPWGDGDRARAILDDVLRRLGL